MEGNGDEGIEQREEDQLWAPPAAANRTTPTSTAPGKEIMSIDDEAIFGVNPRSAAAAQNIHKKEIGIQDMTAASSGIQLRKRKATLSPPSTVLDLDQHFVIPEDAFGIWTDLNASNMLALYALKKGKSKSTAAEKANEILFCQEKLITELKKLFLSCTDKHVPLGSLAFMKIKSLLNLSDDLFPLLKNLPDVSELLLDQDKKVTELRRRFMVAAAEPLPPTAPVDVMSPSTDSSESVSSKLCLQ